MRLQLVTILVDAYDPAITFFVDALGFELVSDHPATTNDGRPKRWVVVRPPGGQTRILLAKADGPAQERATGAQLGGRVGFFLEVDDVDRHAERMKRMGVRFVVEPEEQPFGRRGVFLDIAGNRWDLLQIPSISIIEAPITVGHRAVVSSRFRVSSAVDLDRIERHVRSPSIPTRSIPAFDKDYDLADPAGSWSERFDTTHWGRLVAQSGAHQLGEAVVVWRTDDVEMLEGRSDLVVLWDLRVAASARGRGVGRALFDAAARWGHARGAGELKVETQDINVAACRLYASRGCSLAEVNRGAYADHPGEVQLIWRLPLATFCTSSSPARCHG